MERIFIILLHQIIDFAASDFAIWPPETDCCLHETLQNTLYHFLSLSSLSVCLSLALLTAAAVAVK